MSEISQDAKERLIAEERELELKLEKLNAFNQSDKAEELDTHQRNLLLIQAGVMFTYDEILKARIECL